MPLVNVRQEPGGAKKMKSVNSLYMKLIEECIQEIGERMKCMKLGERNVEVENTQQGKTPICCTTT